MQGEGDKKFVSILLSPVNRLTEKRNSVESVLLNVFPVISLTTAANETTIQSPRDETRLEATRR